MKNMDSYERRWDNPNRRWVYAHREVMEAHLGRELSSKEHVHHINDDPRDNRIENLQVVSPVEHLHIHKPYHQKPKKYCTTENCNTLQHAKGLCKKHQMRLLRSQGKCK